MSPAQPSWPVEDRRQVATNHSGFLPPLDDPERRATIADCGHGTTTGDTGSRLRRGSPGARLPPPRAIHAFSLGLSLDDQNVATSCCFLQPLSLSAAAPRRP